MSYVPAAVPNVIQLLVMSIKNVLCSETINTPLFSGDLLGTSVIFCCQNLCQATSKLLWISCNSLPAWYFTLNAQINCDLHGIFLFH